MFLSGVPCRSEVAVSKNVCRSISCSIDLENRTSCRYHLDFHVVILTTGGNPVRGNVPDWHSIWSLFFGFDFSLGSIMNNETVLIELRSRKGTRVRVIIIVHKMTQMNT